MSIVRRAWAPMQRLVRKQPRDGSAVVVRFVGRHSAEIRERTVAVARDDTQLIAVMPNRGRGWWRQFRPRGPAVLVLDGVELGVVGRTIDGDVEAAELAGALRTYLRQFPRAARELGVDVATPAWADLEPFAPGLVAVVFDL